MLLGHFCMYFCLCLFLWNIIITEKIYIFINCGNFLRKNQATGTELYITTRKSAFDTAEVLKTFEIHQYIGFFIIEGLLELFMAYVRPANIRPTMRNY